jgi:hypothetical protein
MHGRALKAVTSAPGMTKPRVSMTENSPLSCQSAIGWRSSSFT